MATTTASDLIARVRQRADMPDADGLVSDSEILTYISDSYGELMDIIASKNEDAVTQVVDITTSTLPIRPEDITGESVTPPSRPNGWSKIRHIFYLDGGDWRRLEQIPISEWDKYLNTASGRPLGYSVVNNLVGLLPAPSGAFTLKIAYIPSYAGALSSSDVIEVVPIAFRWEEFVVISAAIKCLRKEESDTSELQSEKDAIQLRISSSLSSRGGPQRVSEVRKYRSSWDWDWES